MIVKLLNVLIEILIILVVIHAIGSWFPQIRNSKFYWYIDFIVEPLLRPIRNVIKPVNGIDFSPLILIFILVIIQRILR